MQPATISAHYFNGQAVAPERLGELRRSDDILDDTPALKTRMKDDGYLFLPGYLDRGEVKAARQTLCDRLAAAGVFDSSYSAIEAVAKPGIRVDMLPGIAENNPELDRVLHDGPMIAFFTRFLGGLVRHFDYTWVRVKSPGPTPTNPHYDVVYMGRGTHRLFTAWTPFSDCPYGMGGLIILENSHKHSELRNTYGRFDIDTFCENAEEMEREGRQRKDWSAFGGQLSDDIFAVQKEWGGRWLTTEYAMGDVLIFSMYTLHGSFDNMTDRIRLSTDTRYQLAAEPADPRWIGPDPPKHGPNAKRGLIC